MSSGQPLMMLTVNCLSLRLSIHLPICLPTHPLSIHPSIRPSACLRSSVNSKHVKKTTPGTLLKTSAKRKS